MAGLLVIVAGSMNRLTGSGIAVEVPSGWEGRIDSRTAPAAHPPASQGLQPQGAAPVQNAVLHVSSFPLPPGVGDYGGGAVERMANRDLLVVLMEHGPQSVGTALFRRRAPPGDHRRREPDVPATHHRGSGRRAEVLHGERPGVLSLRRVRLVRPPKPHRPRGERPPHHISIT